jgi:hypothetical protein
VVVFLRSGDLTHVVERQLKETDRLASNSGVMNACPTESTVPIRRLKESEEFLTPDESSPCRRRLARTQRLRQLSSPYLGITMSSRHDPGGFVWAYCGWLMLGAIGAWLDGCGWQGIVGVFVILLVLGGFVGRAKR